MNSLFLALSDADFQWTTRIENIWRDMYADIPELQLAGREQIGIRLVALERVENGESPLGLAILGQGGSGKTHLLSAVRADVLSRGYFFVLADMTDIRDFWETVLVGYIRSLDQKVDGVMQSSRLLGKLAARVSGVPSVEELAAARPPALINRCNLLINALGSQYRGEMREHQDVLRALVLLASNDFDIQDRGQQWLQGLSITEDDAFRHGFMQTQKKPEQIVRGLSWLMSLAAPTVLALDQLDAIVAEHNLASAAEKDTELTPRQQASLAIIQGLAGGLSALRDLTRSTLTLVSSLGTTWKILEQRAPVTMRDRFEAPIFLEAIHDAASIRRLIELRLERAYSGRGVSPPYASYPFADGFFESRIGALPREVLKACREHQLACMAAGTVAEVGKKGSVAPPPPRLDDVQGEFDGLVAAADVSGLLERQDEDVLDKLIEVGCEALIDENPLPDHCDALVDRDFAGTGSFEPLHARLRVVDRSASDRELHYAFRFLEKTHHIAFQSRLKAAITSAGIDPALEFRRLAVFRTRPIPGGALSERLANELTTRGGKFLRPSAEDLKVLVALKELLGRGDPTTARARAWLRKARPVSRLPIFSEAVEFLFHAQRPPELRPAPAKPERDSAPVNRPIAATTAQSVATTRSDRVTKAQPPASREPGTITIGTTRAVTPTPVHLDAEQLKRHVAVLGGSGSGKTTLALSILEQLLLQGIPVLLVDRKGDLCRYGDAELRRSVGASPELLALLDATEVAVYTPGQSRGRSLSIALLPSGLEKLDASERADAYRDAAAGLSSMLRLKDTGADQSKQAILLQALRTLGESQSADSATLSALVELIGGDDPILLESLGHLDPKHCKKLAEQLQAMSIMRSELLEAGHEALSAELLFGLGAHASSGRPRLSIVSTKFLGDETAVLFWVSQLLLELNRFASRNPSPRLQAAVMFDEADIYLPATSKPPTKPPLESLLKRARSAGISVMLATQSPGDLDYKCRENVRNWFVGLVKEPRALDKLRPLLSDAKLDATSVLPKQKVGQFFMLSETAAVPLSAGRNLVETQQLSEPEIISIAGASVDRVRKGMTRQ
jgi:hypothetical protein